jgi:Zn-dependent protease/CBS domain-containing protein
VVVLLFFIGLLLHELAHSLVAKRRGLEVDNIRLFFLGGVSNIKKEPRTAFEEFIVTVVGPLTSAVLGGLFLALHFILGPDTGVFFWATGWLAFVNLTIAVFNMLPAYPLDGGRVLKSAIWGITKDGYKALRYASRVGQVFAGLFMGLGAFLLLNGLLFDGLILLFIGWYLWSAARQSYAQAVAEHYLKGLQVGQVMSQPFAVLFPNATITQAVYEFFMRGNPVVPVVEEGYLAGILTEEEIRKIPQIEWNNVRVVDVMRRRGSLEVARPTDDLEPVLKRLAETRQPVMPVLNTEGYFIGLLTPVDVARFLQMRMRFGDNLPPIQPPTYYGGPDSQRQTWSNQQNSVK